MNETENISPPNDPVFAEPWEAQAFAMAVKLNKQGVFTWSEWATVFGEVIKTNEERPYYENWLAALEIILAANKLVEAEEHENRTKAWAEAEAATPHGEPIQLECLVTGR